MIFRAERAEAMLSQQRSPWSLALPGRAAVAFLLAALCQRSQAQIVPTVAYVPAGSYGATIVAALPDDTSASPDAQFCFYTGYGSLSPIVPKSFTPAASGATVTFEVPPSTIQEVPPSAFSNGSFSALLYAVPLSATSCTGYGQAPQDALVYPIKFPTLNSLNLVTAPQQNPNLAGRIPAGITLVGTNFVARSQAGKDSPSIVAFTPNDSFSGAVDGKVAFVNPSTLFSAIPSGLPSSPTAINVAVCNTAVFSYCTSSLPVSLIPLQVQSGTLTPTQTSSTSSQPIGFSATFGTSLHTVAGAPSGAVTFTDAGAPMVSSHLVLDPSATFVSALPETFPTTSLALQPIVADFNRDGVPDVLVIEPGYSASGKSFPLFHLLLGATPAGKFAREDLYTGFETHPCTTLLSTAVADFNLDGFPDLAVLCSNPGSSEVVYTLLNKHNGSFSYSLISYGPVYGASIVAADFNQDGNPDIAIAGAVDALGTTGIQVLLGKGNGTFKLGPKSSGLDTAPSASFGGFQIATADFNLDGFPDIAILNGAGPSGTANALIQVLQNAGDETFARATTVATDGTSSAKFFAAPLGPGLAPNLFVVSTGSNPGISLAKSTGSGSVAFSGALLAASVPGLSQVVSGDFNGDGLLDVAVEDPTTVHVLAGNGTGTFAAQYPMLAFRATPPVDLIAATDLNGDTYADLLTLASTPLNSAGISTSTLLGHIVAGTATAIAAPALFAPGVHRILATTPGTFEIAGASAEAALVVSGEPSTVRMSASVPSPATYATPLTLYASVLDQTATGIVSFYNGVALMGTAPLISAGSYAVASFTPATLGAGDYLFQAIYEGDAHHPGKYSPTFAFHINPIPATLAWTPTVATLSYGAPLASAELNAGATGVHGVTVAGGFTYSPATGSVLATGTHLLSVTFTPSDPNYAAATATSMVTVNQAAPVLQWTPSVSTIVYGTGLASSQLDAVAATPYNPSVPGTFTYTPGPATVLTAGVQKLAVTFTPDDAINYRAASGSVSITVGKATPTLTWATPADIVVGTALSGTQLNATAAGITGTALPGTFSYTPAAGATLETGTRQLTVLFTPTDSVNYATATASVSIDVVAILLSSVSPSTGLLGDLTKTMTLTGAGFAADAVVHMNDVAVPTTYVSGTSLTAVVPAAQLQKVQSIKVSVFDPAQDQSSNSLPFTITAPSTTVGITAPTSITPASQNTVTFQLNPYPADVTATCTIAFQPASGLSDDPMIVFAISGTRTAMATVPAHSAIANLPIEFNGGTVAGTLTLTLTLEAGGADVTPSSIKPIVIQAPVAVPGVSSVALDRDGNTLTVTARGYSNDRKMTTATFHFLPSAGNSFSTPFLTLDVGSLFSSWYADSASEQYGSQFTYSETFHLDSNASAVGQVIVTLTNDAGNSQEATTP